MDDAESKVSIQPFGEATDQDTDETTVYCSAWIKVNEQLSGEPVQVVTKQRADESVYVLKGKHNDRPAWHAILVPFDKRPHRNLAKGGAHVRVEDFGRNIEYLDESGGIHQASGFSEQPPAKLMAWIRENYGECTVDDTAGLIYTQDDLRLCTIHGLSSLRSIGVTFRYHRHEQFHYVRLDDEQCSTLAAHAGLKPFDRVIEYNGVNIENSATDDLKTNSNGGNAQLIQLLVCNPATYAHYKTNGRQLHSNLPGVQCFKPVRDVRDPFGLIDGTKDFCAVRWENSDNIDVVPLLQVCLASHSVQLYEECHVLTRNLQDNGQIIFIGAQHECEPLHYDANTTSHSQEDDDALFVTALHQLSPSDSPFGQPASSRDNDQVETGAAQSELSEREHLVEQLVMPWLEKYRTVPNRAELHATRCHGCGSARIFGDRYRCLECREHDLCGRCFERRVQTVDHRSGHPMIQFTAPNTIGSETVSDAASMLTLTALRERYLREVHVEVMCSVCQTTPIKGLRFQCSDCSDYHLCCTCMDIREHDPSHTLLAVGQARLLEIPVEDVVLNDELGRGAFGTVYKAKWLSQDRDVACKVITLSPERMYAEKSFRKELAAYAELSAPCILKTYGYNVQPTANGARRCMILMEHMSRGSLAAVLQRNEPISLRRKLEMACQIASGMRWLHAHRMVHRDIRPDNILVAEDYTTKIGDMGLTRTCLPDEPMTLIGCTPYMPQEFYTGKYGQSIDIYTFGLTIYHLFTGRRHRFDLLNRRLYPLDGSPVFTELMARCTDLDVARRPSATEIEMMLCMHKEVIEKYLFNKLLKYVDMSINEKDGAFLKTYEALHPAIDKILRRQFAPAILTPL